VPVGDCERDFQASAEADGLPLISVRHRWLNQRGHLGLPEEAAPVVPLLAAIFGALDGDAARLATARTTPLPNDYFHEPSGTLVEVDEFQHFTSARLMTLRMYPEGQPLGYDLAAYVALCEQTAARADRYRQTKDAACFGQGGRQRQRAYNDALRDLAAPALGHPGVVRAAALEQNGAVAWRRVRPRFSSVFIPNVP
jgi:hypothetical protein